jgi:hypothetical protein
MIELKKGMKLKVEEAEQDDLDIFKSKLVECIKTLMHRKSWFESFFAIPKLFTHFILLPSSICLLWAILGVLKWITL